MRKTLVYSILITFPVLFLVLGLSFQRAHYSADPEYAYLLNGLNVAQLRSVGHFDHPGSTTQMWNAAVLRITHFLDFSSKDSLEDAVLKDPDKYIGILITSIKFLNAIIMFLLGWVAYRRTANLIPALILQASYFLSSNMLEETWTKLSPEPMLIAAVSLTLMVLINYMYSHERHKSKYAVFFALTIAFGMASKVTLLPLAIIPFLVLEKWKNKIVYVVASIPAFIIFTAPALPAYKLMIRWFTGLSTHSGIYGQGKKGFIDMAVYVQNILAILKNNLPFAVTLLVAVLFLSITLFIRKSRNEKLFDKMLIPAIAISLAQFIGILLVAKHYHMNHYLFPVLCLTGINWIFIMLMAAEIFRFDKKFLNGSYLFVLTGIILVGLSNRSYLVLADHYYRLTNKEYDEISATLEKDFKGYALVDYYPYSINKLNALKWGNIYSRQQFTAKLEQLYGPSLFYDIYEKSFTRWNTKLPGNILKDQFGSRLLMVGGTISENDSVQLAESGIRIQPISRGRTQHIYLIDSSSVALNSQFEEGTLNAINFDMESLSHDKSWFVQGNERLEAGNTLFEGVAHSGKYCSRLTAKELYGLPYQLREIAPGQVYRVSIWRKGDESNTYLVAASEISGKFYAQSTDYMEGSRGGWNKISLEFSVPDYLTSGNIKIYVWNNSGKDAFFDDLTITRLK